MHPTSTRRVPKAPLSRLESLTKILVADAIGKYLEYPDKLGLAVVLPGILQTLAAADPNPLHKAAHARLETIVGLSLRHALAVREADGATHDRCAKVSQALDLALQLTRARDDYRASLDSIAKEYQERMRNEKALELAKKNGEHERRVLELGIEYSQPMLVVNSPKDVSRAMEISMQLDELDDAEKLARSFLKQAPSNPDVSRALIDILMRKRAFPEARSAIGEALAAHGIPQDEATALDDRVTFHSGVGLGSAPGFEEDACNKLESAIDTLGHTNGTVWAAMNSPLMSGMEAHPRFRQLHARVVAARSHLHGLRFTLPDQIASIPVAPDRRPTPHTR